MESQDERQQAEYGIQQPDVDSRPEGAVANCKQIKQNRACVPNNENDPTPFNAGPVDWCSGQNQPHGGSSAGRFARNQNYYSSNDAAFPRPPSFMSMYPPPPPPPPPPPHVIPWLQYAQSVASQSFAHFQQDGCQGRNANQRQPQTQCQNCSGDQQWVHPGVLSLIGLWEYVATIQQFSHYQYWNEQYDSHQSRCRCNCSRTDIDHANGNVPQFCDSRQTEQRCHNAVNNMPCQCRSIRTQPRPDIGAAPHHHNMGFTQSSAQYQSLCQSCKCRVPQNTPCCISHNGSPTDAFAYGSMCASANSCCRQERRRNQVRHSAPPGSSVFERFNNCDHSCVQTHYNMPFSHHRSPPPPPPPPPPPLPPHINSTSQQNNSSHCCRKPPVARYFPGCTWVPSKLDYNPNQECSSRCRCHDTPLPQAPPPPPVPVSCAARSYNSQCTDSPMDSHIHQWPPRMKTNSQQGRELYQGQQGDYILSHMHPGQSRSCMPFQHHNSHSIPQNHSNCHPDDYKSTLPKQPIDVAVQRPVKNRKPKPFVPLPKKGFGSLHTDRQRHLSEERKGLSVNANKKPANSQHFSKVHSQFLDQCKNGAISKLERNNSEKDKVLHVKVTSIERTVVGDIVDSNETDGPVEIAKTDAIQKQEVKLPSSIRDNNETKSIKNSNNIGPSVVEIHRNKPTLESVQRSSLYMSLDETGETSSLIKTVNDTRTVTDETEHNSKIDYSKAEEDLTAAEDENDISLKPEGELQNNIKPDNIDIKENIGIGTNQIINVTESGDKIKSCDIDISVNVASQSNLKVNETEVSEKGSTQKVSEIATDEKIALLIDEDVTLTSQLLLGATCKELTPVSDGHHLNGQGACELLSMKAVNVPDNGYKHQSCVDDVNETTQKAIAQQEDAAKYVHVNESVDFMWKDRKGQEETGCFNNVQMPVLFDDNTKPDSSITDKSFDVTRTQICEIKGLVVSDHVCRSQMSEVHLIQAALKHFSKDVDSVKPTAESSLESRDDEAYPEIIHHEKQDNGKGGIDIKVSSIASPKKLKKNSLATLGRELTHKLVSEVVLEETTEVIMQKAPVLPGTSNEIVDVTKECLGRPCDLSVRPKNMQHKKSSSDDVPKVLLSGEMKSPAKTPEKSTRTVQSPVFENCVEVHLSSTQNQLDLDNLDSKNPSCRNTCSAKCNVSALESGFKVLNSNESLPSNQSASVQNILPSSKNCGRKVPERILKTSDDFELTLPDNVGKSVELQQLEIVEDHGGYKFEAFDSNKPEDIVCERDPQVFNNSQDILGACGGIHSITKLSVKKEVDHNDELLVVGDIDSLALSQIDEDGVCRSGELVVNGAKDLEACALNKTDTAVRPEKECDLVINFTKENVDESVLNNNAQENQREADLEASMQISSGKETLEACGFDVSQQASANIEDFPPATAQRETAVGAVGIDEELSLKEEHVMFLCDGEMFPEKPPKTVYLNGADITLSQPPEEVEKKDDNQECQDECKDDYRVVKYRSSWSPNKSANRSSRYINPAKVGTLRYQILQSPLVMCDVDISDDEDSDVMKDENGEVIQDYPLGYLPTYIVAQIFSYLGTRDLAALKCACKDFRWLIDRYNIRGSDSRWLEADGYKEDPCYQCGKIRDARGDVSLCRWHPKIYYKNGHIGRRYWTCCFALEEDAIGCQVGLHDNNWVLSGFKIRKVPRPWRNLFWRGYSSEMWW